MNLMQRVAAPTPLFFRKIRRIGILLAAISGAILAAPSQLPTVVVTVATYLGIAGSVATAISQTATDSDTEKPARF